MNIWPFRRRSVPACEAAPTSAPDSVVTTWRPEPASADDLRAVHADLLNRLDNLHRLVASERKPRPRAGKRRAKR